MARILLVRGPGAPSSFPISSASPSTIGRTQENDVFVVDRSLSRRHARVEPVGGRWLISDLGSKNGTFVNGERVAEAHPLRAGDRIRCGDVELTFESTSDDAVAANLTVVRDVAGAGDNSIDDLVLRGGASGPSALRVRRIEGSAEGDRRAQDKLEILLRVSRLLSSPERIDALLPRVLDLVVQILDVDRAVLLMVDPATSRLEPRVMKTLTPTRPGEAVYSRHIVDYVREHSVAALFGDARIDPRLGEAASVYAQSIRASMCTPLKGRAGVLGVLYVDNQLQANRFTAEDLDFLAAFAAQAAVAIENAMLYRRIEEEAVLRNTLLRFFPPTTANQLLSAGTTSLQVIETDVTAVFADISGFTAMSARMEPRALVEMLNEYFGVVAEVVFRNEGTLEKYIGDALLAVWGAPFAHPDDVDRAIRAAAEMQHAVRALNERWAGRRSIAIHVGMNTGRVAAGNIGSERYIQYAAIGEPTNLASRICNVAGEGEIVASRATLDRWHARDLPVEPLPPTVVRGKDQPLELFRVRWDLGTPLDT